MSRANTIQNPSLNATNSIWTIIKNVSITLFCTFLVQESLSNSKSNTNIHPISSVESCFNLTFFFFFGFEENRIVFFNSRFDQSKPIILLICNKSRKCIHKPDSKTKIVTDEKLNGFSRWLWAHYYIYNTLLLYTRQLRAL